MTETTPSTAFVTIESTFTDSERLALASCLVRYRGLTRESYTPDLRQFTGWCRARSLPLFSVRRDDVETSRTGGPGTGWHTVTFRAEPHRLAGKWCVTGG